MAQVTIEIDVDASEVSDAGGTNVQAALDEMRAQIAALQTGNPPAPSGPAKFSDDSSCVAFWNFDDTLAEGKGNSSLTLIKELGAAAPEYLDITSGYRGLHVYPGQRYGISQANSAPLKLQGDMSLQMIVRIDTAPAANFFLSAFGGSTEASAENMHYELMFYTANPGFPLQPSYFHEHGLGENDESTDPAGLVPANGTTYLLGFVRTGNSVQLYLNGQPLGAPTTGMTPLDGGESGRFVIGGLTQSSSPCHWMLGGVKVNDAALSPAEMAAEYAATLGA
jgi:hypothetical protein